VRHSFVLFGIISSFFFFASAGCPADTSQGGDAGVDGGVDGGGSTGWSLSKSCDEGWRIFCEKQLDCGFIPDSASCIEEGRKSCAGDPNPLSDAVQAGRLTYDGDAAKTCFESLSAADCLTPWDQLLASPECRGYFSGGVADGQPCYSSGLNECATGACVRDASVCPGVCIPWLDVGGDCSSDRAFACRLGTYCDGSVCALRGGVGDACTTLLPWSCDAGLSCVVSGASIDGLCQATVPEGGSCTHSSQCLLLSTCVGGSCHKKIATGEACTVDWNCPSGERCYDADGDYFTPNTCAPPIALDQDCLARQPCAGDLICVMNQGTGTRTCVVDSFAADCALCLPTEWCDSSLAQALCFPLGAEGDVCNSNTLEGCGAGLYCDGAETCSLLGALGDSCSQGYECETGVCGSDGSCAAVCERP